jgi:Tfp pilus assembly protein PilV
MTWPINMRSPSKTLRRGMTVLEVTVALLLLTMGFVFTAQVLTQCANQHAASEQQLTAQWEAANVLERLAGLRYEELTSDSVKTTEPSHQLRAALPDAKLQIAVTDSNADSSTAPPHKRIRIEITWPTQEGSPHSVSLTAWKYPAPTEAAKTGTGTAQ